MTMPTLEQKLKVYATENNTATDVYHTALRLITNMRIKAEFNAKYKEVLNVWLVSCSTLDLKTALAGITYDENNLVHFNTFALLDAIAIK